MKIIIKLMLILSGCATRNMNPSLENENRQVRVYFHKNDLRGCYPIENHRVSAVQLRQFRELTYVRAMEYLKYDVERLHGDSVLVHRMDFNLEDGAEIEGISFKCKR